MALEYAAGIILALTVGASATLFGFDRDRAFYPTIMIVIASYYALFAIMGGSISALAMESLVISAFFIASLVGFRGSLWVVVVALAAHGLYDFLHGQVFTNPGVPSWWPSFCLAYDVAAGCYLAWLLTNRRIRAGAL